MNNGFILVRNLVEDKELLNRIHEHAKSIAPFGKSDPQTPGAPAFHKELEMTKLQLKLYGKIEKLTGKKLYPTYNYFRMYNSSSKLEKHRDRPACEYSVTLCIGYEGDYNWDIFMQGNDNIDYSFKLEPGDAIIYKGCENLHWRNPPTGNVLNHVQVFLHFVDQDGPYSNEVNEFIR